MCCACNTRNLYTVDSSLLKYHNPHSLEMVLVTMEVEQVEVVEEVEVVVVVEVVVEEVVEEVVAVPYNENMELRTC